MRRLGDLLAHPRLGEFLLVLGVYTLRLGADEFGFLDGEFFVGFEVDFARFFQRFLFDEGGHFAEFGGDLVVGHGVYLGHVGGEEWLLQEQRRWWVEVEVEVVM